MNQKYSFIEFLSKPLFLDNDHVDSVIIDKVEIPIIQRDYAQGRKNAKEIRNDFLRDIFVHLNNNQPMKLSFVYGTTSGGMYVPYDGQQRLTLVYLLTLFLTKC